MVILTVIPILLLTGIIYYITYTPIFDYGEPLPKIVIERVEFKPEMIVVYVRNIGQDTVTIAQTDIDDAPIDAIIKPTNVLTRLSSAQLMINYRWIEGRPYEIGITTSDGTRFASSIEIATLTPEPDSEQLFYFALLGIYVGVIPVALGFLWFPSMQRVREHWNEFFLSITAGLLVFLAMDAIVEAFEIVDKFVVMNNSKVLIPMIMISTFLFLLLTVNKAGDSSYNDGNISSTLNTPDNITTNDNKDDVVTTNHNLRLHIAYMISVGIGLHNLGEGLAIGAALAVGAIALSKFLIIGFTIHNSTEGFAIASPLVRSKVKIAHFAMLGMIAGIPTIVGTWIGGFINIPIVSVVFLAVGAGAILQVVYAIFGLMSSKMSVAILSKYNIVGLVTGMLVMYLTSLLV
ncbi:MULTISPECIES: ZIP family metal transporter [Candidatus Nitrosocaldus]|jgi:zinc transporter ZupT|nr:MULTISPECIES: divalent cation transporter [Candidatus Nitrosocaldus]